MIHELAVTPHSLKYWALDEASKQNQIKHLILMQASSNKKKNLVDSSVVAFVLQNVYGFSSCQFWPSKLVATQLPQLHRKNIVKKL